MTNAGEVLREFDKNESWYKKVWRPASAFIYLTICMVDFAIMPLYMEYSNSNQDVVAIINELPEPAQEKATSILFEKRSWEPVTLQGGAFFHIAFGALLTGAAVTRGREKEKRVEKLA